MNDLQGKKALVTGTIATKPDRFAQTLSMDYDFVVMTSLMNFMKFGIDAFLG